MTLWLVRGLGRFDARRARRAVGGGRALSRRRPPVGSTIIGVIGLGRIGARVAAQAAALGFGVLGYDPVRRSRRAASGSTSLRGPAAPRPHLVTLHAPLTPETRHLIRAETHRADAPRGAAGQHLPRRPGRRGRAGRGAARGAARRAPRWTCSRPSRCPRTSPLRSLPNVLLTPHAAWYSKASLAASRCGRPGRWWTSWPGRPVPAIVNPGYLEHVRPPRPRPPSDAVTPRAASPGCTSWPSGPRPPAGRCR